MSMSKSFTTYRKPSDEVITSDEDEVIEDSFSANSVRNSRSRYKQRSENSTILNSSTEIVESSESDDEPIGRIKNFNRKARVLTDSESNISENDESPMQSKRNSSSMSKLALSEDSEGNLTEEDDEFERRALSPRTRMSITGFRPRDISDDESDFIDDSSEENIVLQNEPSQPQEEKVPVEHSKVENSDPFSEEEDELHSFDPEKPPKEGSPSLLLSNSLKGANDSIDGKFYRKGVNSRSSLDDKSDLPNRMSMNFNSSIASKLSSTVINPHVDKKANESSGIVCLNSPSVESPVTLLPLKGETIEISSASETSLGSTSTPTRGNSKNLIQPKIKSLLQRANNSEVEGAAPIKYVSREYYDTQLKKLSELKTEWTTCENLINTLGSKLPDKGKRMSGRGERLKAEIEKLALYISTLKVDDSFVKEEKPLVKPEVPPMKLNAPSWEELTNAANAIQPTHTGKVGMANFIAQKTLTIERLKDIHGSLETCPTENILADDPKYLNVTLMNHQKHALAWMYWREKQKPPGGILADDMGLGKTLTMISLVLASSQREEEESEQSEEDSEIEDEDSASNWSRKGKREYYYGGTLVVCPASLIRQWENEVSNRVKRHKVTVCVYHGNNREAKPRTLAKYDMVVTTYNLVSREYKNRSNLYAVKWERIILDEAHLIRNHKSQASEASCKLKGKKRWALTGTPIQNKEMDLYALLKFLKCSPFDELAHWKRWIDNKSAGGQQRLNTLMKSLMLRRTKQQLQEYGNLALPDKNIELVEVALDKEEMAVYQKVMLYSRSLFAQFLHQRAEKNHDLIRGVEGDRPTFLQTKQPNEAFVKMHQRFVRLDRKTEVKSHEILVLLLRLRQICCHPGLIDSMLEDEDNVSTHDESSFAYHQEIDLLEQLNNLQINDGNSSTGLSESLNASKEKAISKALSKALWKSNPVFNLTRLSSKMQKVIDVFEKKILNTSDKALIVSQWTSVLEILKGHLARKGIVTVSLNGSVPVKYRNDIVNDFNNPNNNKKIMLLSLTAGGVGLNLVGANHLFLIDLHWNPQLEAQAQDRIYRVGQKKTVYIYKFMCKETVEERIKMLQDHKLAIASGVLTGVKSSESSKLSIDDLKSLFGL